MIYGKKSGVCTTSFTTSAQFYRHYLGKSTIVHPPFQKTGRFIIFFSILWSGQNNDILVEKLRETSEDERVAIYAYKWKSILLVNGLVMFNFEEKLLNLLWKICTWRMKDRATEQRLYNFNFIGSWFANDITIK